MKWESIMRELKPKRIFNLVKLGFLNYLQWPLGAISYSIIIYGLCLKYVFPNLTLVEGVGIFVLGVAMSYCVGLATKVRHRIGGLYRGEQAMITEAHPFANLNHEITSRQLDLTIETTEANIKWLRLMGIDTARIEEELVPFRKYRKVVGELLAKWD
jgi:hypothetical protein